MAIEEPKYAVSLREGACEVRDYQAAIAAEVSVTGDQKSAARKGFRLLAGYIFGGNRRPAPWARLFEITRDDARRRNRSPAASRLRGNSSFRLSATRTRDRERGLIRKHLIEKLGKPMRFGSPRHRKAPE